ncbi:hypothetical protein WMF31_07060 [Sorangium sp. So ce1036]|uniref:hypothetical protein n=1 Tax=Sorangium sp. So ce1036 TaxID=3133328 RepID=UPI003F0B9FD7
MEPLPAIRLPEALRDPPPRRWAALWHARHQLAGLGAGLLFWGGLLVASSLFLHIDAIAMAFWFSLAAAPLLLLYQGLGCYAACQVALRGAPSAAQVYEGVVVTRFTTVKIWHVVVSGEHVRIRADAPLVKSMVVLVTPETRRGKRRIGVYHPKVGICTSMV